MSHSVRRAGVSSFWVHTTHRLLPVPEIFPDEVYVSQMQVERGVVRCEVPVRHIPAHPSVDTVAMVFNDIIQYRIGFRCEDWKHYVLKFNIPTVIAQNDSQDSHFKTKTRLSKTGLKSRIRSASRWLLHCTATYYPDLFQS